MENTVSEELERAAAEVYESNAEDEANERFARAVRGAAVLLPNLDGVPYDEVTRAEIPPTVRRIADGGLSYYFSLKAAVLPDGLEEIGREAFVHCRSLEEVNVPKTVRSVGDDAFYGCPDATVFFEGRARAEVEAMAGYPWGLAPGQLACQGDCGEDDVELVTERTARAAEALLEARAGDEANERFARSVEGREVVRVNMMGQGRAVDPLYRKVTRIRLPETVRRIADGGLSYYRGLKAAELDDGLEEIGRGAFGHCDSLEEVNVPASVGRIGAGAFLNCPRARVYFEGRTEGEVREMTDYPWGLKRDQMVFLGDAVDPGDVELVTEAER